MSEQSQPVDDLFLDYPNEWYEGMDMSSAHNADSIVQFDLPHSYILFAYPRDHTPVCIAELESLHYHARDFPIQVIAGSTDSPETHNVFFGNTETFPGNVDFPILTITDKNLTDKGRGLLLNEYGYCKRVAIIVIKGFMRGMYQVDDEKQRDVDSLLRLTKHIFNNN